MSCKRADPLENDLLTLHIDIAGRLVKYIDRTVMQERSGKSQALLLSARQVLRVFREHCIKSVISLAPKEFIHPALGKDLPQLVICRGRIAHKQVVPDRSLEEIGVGPDICDPLHNALFRALGERHAVDQDRTALHCIAAGKERRDRGFAASALSYDTDKAVSGDLHVDSAQDFPLSVIGKAHAL